MIKTRIALLLLAAAMVAFGVISMSRRSGRRPAEVPIQDGKTIDFSSGKGVVADDQKSKAAIDNSVKQMDAAASSVSFPATATSTTTTTTEAGPTPPVRK